jgi:carbon monoxide dehydrogenase subunit G
VKFKGSIDIDQPPNKVLEFFADPKNLKEYQDGFQNKELVSGNEGEDGDV